ncbi:MAG: hypothetical protein MZU91_05740 [Desulfosudis oleivorans]|nr:hypothetical protein [Desulfosudis oleivorans]
MKIKLRVADGLYSPLNFDLTGNGITTLDKVISFDINGDGVLDKIHDVSNGVLAIRNGANGHDLFGDSTDLDGDGIPDGYMNGFEALKALARKEGLINDKDDMMLDKDDIKLLEEKYDLGMKTNGYLSEKKPLSELGIDWINLSQTDETSVIEDFDGKGNLLMTQENSWFSINGIVNTFVDIWHRLVDFISDLF